LGTTPDVVQPPAGVHVALAGSAGAGVGVGVAALDCVGVAGVVLGAGGNAATANDALGSDADPVPTRLAAATVQV
jgi:hypothetical protein